MCPLRMTPSVAIATRAEGATGRALCATLLLTFVGQAAATCVDFETWSACANMQLCPQAPPSPTRPPLVPPLPLLPPSPPPASPPPPVFVSDDGTITTAALAIAGTKFCIDVPGANPAQGTTVWLCACMRRRTRGPVVPAHSRRARPFSLSPGAFRSYQGNASTAGALKTPSCGSLVTGSSASLPTRTCASTP